MTPALRSMVAATYVRDIDTSRAFYGLLGFHEHSAGKAATSAWSSLHLGGHRVLLASTRPPAADDETSPRFSLLKEAAPLVEARGGTTATCQVSDIHGIRCQTKADVKLADSGGNTVWACLGHADEILVTVPGAFIATQHDQGITGFLRSRSSRP
jgi:hypothetical protein